MHINKLMLLNKDDFKIIKLQKPFSCLNILDVTKDH